MRSASLHLARACGVLLGAGAAALVVVGAVPAARGGHLPAGVEVSVPLTGTLDVTPRPPHAVLRAGLQPGRPPDVASVRIRNQTGRTLAVGFRARAASRSLDGLLRVRVSAGPLQLADTTLQGLRRGTRSTLAIPSGRQCRFRVRVWIPDEVTTGYEGQRVAVELVPVARTVS